MSPTKVLFGQILVVFLIAGLALWTATQWAAHALGYQAALGPPWFVAFGHPIYAPWALFPWWFAYNAYAPILFDKAGAIAATGGLLGAGGAVVGSVWRARQSRLVTTYGSARWARKHDLRRPALFRPPRLFLARFGH